MAKPASRNPAGDSYLLVTATASQPRSPLVPLTKRVTDSGCNLVEARLATLGQEITVSVLISGTWDAIAKFETTAARLEREEGLQLAVTRTTARNHEAPTLPYMVEVVAADRAGVLYELADFFSGHGISVEQLNSSRYRAMQTGAEMFSAQITIGIPVKTHIAGLRDEFLELCDSLNLDAIMDPIKY